MMDLILEKFLRTKTIESTTESKIEDTSQTHSESLRSGAVRISPTVKSEYLDDSCFYEGSLQSNTSSIHKLNSSFSLDSCSSSSFSEFKSSSVKSICASDSLENDSFLKKEFQNDFMDNSNLVKQELITQLCIDIDIKHQNLNMHISSLVSNCGDLKLNAKFWNYVIHNIGLISFLDDSTDDDFDEVYLTKKQELMKNFYNLLLCLNKLEKELAVYLNKTDSIGEFSFDAEFFLSLAFLIFEKVTSLTKTGAVEKSNKNNIELIFELDMATNNCYDDTIWLFELNLNNLLSNYVLKFLPDLIDLQKGVSENQFIGSGRSSLEFFKHVFYKEKNVSVKTASTNFDIDVLISKPCSDLQEFNNPITQSYRCLINNLNKLKFFAHDPFLEADNEAAERGREVNNVSFGCLAFSYLSMGYFEIKMLLENSFHFLYEIRQFNDEIKDLFIIDDPNEKDTRLWMKKIKQRDEYDTEYYQFNGQTKWNIPNQELKIEKCNKFEKRPISDDIIQRISNIPMPIPVESKFKFAQDSDYLIQELDKHSSSLNSPTKIHNNDLIYNSNDNFSSLSDNQFYAFNLQRLSNLNLDHLNTMNVYNDYNSHSKTTWPKPDPKPIGTKPASMTNLSYSCMNRNRFNKSSTVYYNSNLRQMSPKLDLVENFKIIWNKNQESSKTNEKNDVLKSNNFVETLMNKTPSNPIKNKKYSVAPSSLMIQKSRNKKPNAALSSDSFNSGDIYNSKGLENQVNYCTNFYSNTRSVISHGSDNKNLYSNQILNDGNKLLNSNEFHSNEKSTKKHTVSNIRHQNYSPDKYHYSSRY